MSMISDYLMDRAQRTILFWEVLRKRGNDYLKHIEAGQPPVLVFDYEMVMDGRTFYQPVNYALVHILDRRKLGKLRKGQRDRRLAYHGKALDMNGRPCRPIVVIDPRSGNGPGIGGWKTNSQIGLALYYGHPVYFVLFYTNPEPGQTITRVQQAEVRFLEEVARRHPKAPSPAVIANSQAGWAAALIAAERPDVTGPIVINGSPLSFWAGVEGAYPMRYKAGLWGGAWLASFACDLGNGWFDGVHLVAGCESLDPAYTYWTKLYDLFVNVDTKEESFLRFEKWWGGFFKMSSEEIHFIVNNLFIGNELEQGKLKLDDQKVVNLKNIKDPILIFCSGGDNITIPPQALFWIYKVYGDVDEIKRCGQVIIYMVHEKADHLDIFISEEVTQKEHRLILSSIGWMEYMSPGMYEMVIEKSSSASERDDFDVRFESRDMDDLLQLGDGFEHEEAFEPVHFISRFNDSIYRYFVSPWVRRTAIPPVDRWIRILHPMRMQRYMISDKNPCCWPVKWAAGPIKANRLPVTSENAFVVLENFFSETIKIGLNYYRNMRDLTQEFLFKSIYSNPWLMVMSGIYGKISEATVKRINENKSALKADKGGYVEACVRTIIAIAGTDRIIWDHEFEIAEKIFRRDPKLQDVTPETYKTIINEQAWILETDLYRALDSLPILVPAIGDRKRVYAIAKGIASAKGGKPGKRENSMLLAIREALELGNDGYKNVWKNSEIKYAP